VFFDIAPLKYGSWDEYQSGVTKVLEDFKAARCTVNDDAQIHKSGDAYWVTATVAYDMTHKSGKRDMGNFRWTAVFEKQDGKWLMEQSTMLRVLRGESPRAANCLRPSSQAASRLPGPLRTGRESFPSTASYDGDVVSSGRKLRFALVQIAN
jgi:hypothetical protein